MHRDVMGFSIADELSFGNGEGEPDDSDPVDGESTDGELVYSVSLDKRSEVQIAAFSGRLSSRDGITACQGVLDTVFAATPVDGLSRIILRNIDEISAEGVAVFSTRILDRFMNGGGNVELRMDLNPVYGRLLDRLARGHRPPSLAWDSREQCLTILFAWPML